jgi:hypothetical protein
VLDQLGVTLIFTWTAAVMAATVVAFPLMYKTVLSAFEQVDLTLVSSAQHPGRIGLANFLAIAAALAWPGVLAGTILAFARALGEFGATLMVGGSIPGVTQTIPIAIFFAAEAGRMQVALAWVLLMVGMSLGGDRGHQPGQRSAIAPSPILGSSPLARTTASTSVYFGTLQTPTIWAHPNTPDEAGAIANSARPLSYRSRLLS